MQQCIKNRLKRKLIKMQRVSEQTERSDFIANFSETELLGRLITHLEESKRLNQEVNKGLLLLERSTHFLKSLGNQTIQFDQIPFYLALKPGFGVETLRPEYSQVVSNLAFDWIDPAEFILLLQRVLAPEGHFWFSAFGSQTMQSAQSVLADIDSYPHFNTFFNMKDIGDALLGAGFKEVVVDSTVINLEYKAVNMLLRDARQVFAINLHPDRARTLSPKRLHADFAQKINAIINKQGKFIDQVEISIAHGKQPDWSPRVEIPTQSFT